MTTISVGPIKAHVTISNNTFTGELDLIEYGIANKPILRISSATDSKKGARIQSSGPAQWPAELNGEIVVMNGLYKERINAAVSENGFRIELPHKNIKIGSASSLVTLEGRTLAVKSTMSIGTEFNVLGVSITPTATYVETNSITLDSKNNPTIKRSYKVSASQFGVTVRSPTISLSVNATGDDIPERVYNALRSGMESLIRDNLFGGQIIKLGKQVSGYVSKYGGKIVDAIGSVFGGSSSNPPPPVLINPHADAITVGSTVVQWGQTVSTTDGSQKFPLPVTTGVPISTLLTSVARPNVHEALSVSDRNKNSFYINRDNALDYHVPFHWLGMSEKASGKPHYGVEDKDGVRIIWGRGFSTSDYKQEIKMPGKVGKGRFSVVMTPDQGGVKSNLSLHSSNGGSGKFYVDRDGYIDGKLNFTYIAIGSSPGKSSNPGYLEVDGGMIQWGRAESTKDYEELFKFPKPFKTMDFSVVTTVDKPNVRSSLSQSRPINEEGFVIDRNSRIDGKVPFYWIAVGR